jgi:haloalkane dehalogenase
MHYVDQGPRNASQTVVMLHGEPSWSYLYRAMIGPVSTAGLRVIAPDLIGFGRSDKPTQVGDYSVARHLAWLEHLLIDHLQLREVTVVGQDWGSTLALRLATDHEDRFTRIIIGNGMLLTGDEPRRMLITAWAWFTRYSPWFPVGRIVAGASGRRLSSPERAAYDAPFPGPRFQAGARAFPSLIPVTPDDPASADHRRTWEKLERWNKPFITCYSNADPTTACYRQGLLDRIPGAAGQPHPTLRGKHFLQEDSPEDFARLIIDSCCR